MYLTYSYALLNVSTLTKYLSENRKLLDFSPFELLYLSMSNCKATAVFI